MQIFLGDSYILYVKNEAKNMHNRCEKLLTKEAENCCNFKEIKNYSSPLTPRLWLNFTN